MPPALTHTSHDLNNVVSDHYKFSDAYNDDEAQFSYVTMGAGIQGEDAGDASESPPIPALLPLLALPSLVLPRHGSPKLMSCPPIQSSLLPSSVIPVPVLERPCPPSQFVHAGSDGSEHAFPCRTISYAPGTSSHK